MQASVAIQVLPSTLDDNETVRIVDEVIAYIASTGLNYYVGPFETTIEGDDYDQLMDIVKECQHIAVRAGAPSVAAYVKVSYRPEGEVLSKAEGGEWGLDHLPEKYRPLLRAALDDYASDRDVQYDPETAQEYAGYMLGRIAGNG